MKDYTHDPDETKAHYFNTMIRFDRPRPLEWFYILGGLILAVRYLWFMDDAFVYFRYVDNLVLLKMGLVYNQGEYVEAFISPLWVVLLSLFRAAGINYLLITGLITFICFVAFALMLVKINRQLSPPEATIINFPLAYLAFNYGVLSYFSSGLETPLVQVIAVTYALYILNPKSTILQILLAVSPLIRPELTLPFIICSLWAWVYYKKIPLKMISTAVFLGSFWIILRIYYYADLLPNVFYLKDIVDFKQGILYIHNTLAAYYFYVVVVVFSFLTIIKIKSLRPDMAKRLMMILTAVSVALYIVKIGGDSLHFRYLAFSFILATCAFSGILEVYHTTSFSSRYKKMVPALGVVIALLVLSFYPAQLDKHPILHNVDCRHVDKIADAAYARKALRKFLSFDKWREKDRNIFRILKSSRQGDNSDFRYKGVIAGWRCSRNYTLLDMKVIHPGLTDAILARTEMKSVRPAHKVGLWPLAEDIVSIHKASDLVGRGMYRRAVEKGNAPKWVEKNLEAIEVIEHKIYNTHNFWENLKLAFTFPKRVKP